MKRFRFSLETVLKVRRQNEETQKRALAAAQAERDRVLMRLAAEERGLKALLAEQGQRREAGVDLAREAWFMARRGGYVHQIGRAAAELAEKEEALGLARARAVEASRERLVLEKLEEKQLQEHNFQVNREEQGLLDDLAQRAVSAFSLPPTSATGL